MSTITITNATSAPPLSLYPSFLDLPDNFINAINAFLLTGSSATFWLGIQTGTTVLFLLLLVLLTRPAKRRTAVFLLNSLALLLSSIRSICQASYFTSPFWTWKPLFWVYPSDRVARGVVFSQSLAAICAAGQATCIMGSLYLQILAVCAPMHSRPKRLAVLIATATLAIANVVYVWFAAILDISVCIVGWRDLACVSLEGWWQLASWLFQGTVVLFSCVFVGKLGIAIAQRRRLGLRQFGPMHIVAIAGAQTMIVPGMSISQVYAYSLLTLYLAIFAIVQPFSATFAVSASLAMTLVTLSLPLSAIWASEALPDEQEEHRHGSQPGSATAASFRARLFGSRGRLESATSLDVESQKSRGSAAGLWKGLWKKKGSVVEVKQRDSVGSV